MSKESTKEQQLEQIKADILKQNICPDLAKNATNLVMSRGNPDAEIVFIGEAPGKNEDLQGYPFVGAAGKFLDEMLRGINLTIDDVYITNIVKYRPPNNRDPLPEEKRAFWPFLVAELECVSPKLIITLGRHSMEYFLPGMRISEIHGQAKRISVQHSAFSGQKESDTADIGGQAGHPGADAMQGGGEHRTESYQEYDEGEAQAPTQQSAASGLQSGGFADERKTATWVVLPLYHPAAALYNGGLRQTLIDDFAAIPTILKKINQSKSTK